MKTLILFLGIFITAIMGAVQTHHEETVPVTCGVCKMEIDSAREIYLMEYLNDPILRNEVRIATNKKYRKMRKH